MAAIDAIVLPGGNAGRICWCMEANWTNETGERETATAGSLAELHDVVIEARGVVSSIRVTNEQGFTIGWVGGENGWHS